MNERSKQLRRDTIKLSKANGGYHFGGTFSCVEILIALFDHVLTAEDIFILSKGHACWAYYVLLHERGFKPRLEGHPTRDCANGVHWTTGSEGHGLPAGIGMALARRLQGKPGRIFVLMGDGECQEGTTWESMLTAVQHHLDNLVVIVDANSAQGSGWTAQILDVSCLPEVAQSIGWFVSKVDGHNIGDLKICLETISALPHIIMARTIKGKGVDFMENNPAWHAKWLDDEHEKLALKQLT